MAGTGKLLFHPSAETPVSTPHDIEDLVETHRVGVDGHSQADGQAQLARHLYPAAEVSSSLLFKALNLLNESSDRVEEALLSLSQRDYIGGR